jgi:hypothetical protein
MKTSDDNRLFARPYREALEGVTLQFDLMRFALRKLRDGDIRSFQQETLQSRLASLDSMKSKAQQMGHDLGSIIEEVKKHELEMARKRNRKGTRRFLPEFAEDRLNQSELLLLVAHFESFMKLVHRGFLEAAPQKAFGRKSVGGKQKPQVALEDVFDARDQCWQPSKFIRGLVEKEVKRLDQQSTEKKLKYWQDVFGIRLCKEGDEKHLEEIIELRHEISHRLFQPSEPKLNDSEPPPLVRPETLQFARRLLRAIPETCIGHGAKTYQSFFRD